MLSSDWLMKGVFVYQFLVFQLFYHCQGISLINTLYRDACNKICKTLSVVRFIAKLYFAVFTLHRDTCNKICKMLSVVRFM